MLDGMLQEFGKALFLMLKKELLINTKFIRITIIILLKRQILTLEDMNIHQKQPP